MLSLSVVICHIVSAANRDKDFWILIGSNLIFFASPCDQGILTCLKKYTDQSKDQTKVDDPNMQP